MPRKATQKETIKKNTVAAMQKLGTYKPEYDPVIDIYCEMREQYEIYTQRLKKTDYKCGEATAAGGTKKSALVSTIETLRKDILLYSDRLMINPKVFDDSDSGKNAASKLGEILKGLE